MHGRGRTRRLKRWRFISVLLQCSSSFTCWQSHPISCQRGEVTEELFPNTRNCKYEQNAEEAECFRILWGFWDKILCYQTFFLKKQKNKQKKRISVVLVSMFEQRSNFFLSWMSRFSREEKYTSISPERAVLFICLLHFWEVVLKSVLEISPLWFEGYRQTDRQTGYRHRFQLNENTQVSN